MPIVVRSARIQEELSAWIFSKHFLPMKTRLFFTLTSHVLSCHGAKSSRPKWQIDLSGAYVVGSRSLLRISIKSRGRSLKLYFETEHNYCRWLISLQLSASRRIEDQYEFGASIGKGAFGQVFKAIDKCTLEQCAVKMIDKNPDDRFEDDYIWRELNCMRDVSHPNVVRTFNIFDTHDRIHLVLEYLPGGSLKNLLSRRERFSETQTKMIMKDILQGAAYLHEMSIVHRDLKLENILCTAKQFPFRVKIADFGLANFIESVTISEAGLKSQVGSLHYIAPEMLRCERYGPKVDSWSIGVMMYVMLTKMYPFAGSTQQETLEQVLIGSVSFRGPEWTGISREAKVLLKGLLMVDANERLSPREALASPWFYTRTGYRHGLKR